MNYILISVFCVFSQIFAFNPCFQNSEVPIDKKSFDQTLQEIDAELMAKKAAEKFFLTVCWRWDTTYRWGRVGCFLLEIDAEVAVEKLLQLTAEAKPSSSVEADQSDVIAFSP